MQPRVEEATKITAPAALRKAAVAHPNVPQLEELALRCEKGPSLETLQEAGLVLVDYPHGPSGAILSAVYDALLCEDRGNPRGACVYAKEASDNLRDFEELHHMMLG